MEPVLQASVQSSVDRKTTPLWKDPPSWLREKSLGKSFWVFFTAAFFFDFGFAIYFFLFNLYLLDMHFSLRAIGLIGSAMMLGSVSATLPAGFLARKTGVKPLLIVCFVAAPVLGILRAISTSEFTQIVLAFFAGLSMCLWGVCFLPLVARLTTEYNRASAFSLIFAVSIGTSALGGLLCGYLPQWLSRAGFTLQPAEVKRLILLGSCVLAALGLIAVLRLRLPAIEQEAKKPTPWRLNPTLLRLLPTIALWTSAIAAFAPFANIYLLSQLHFPLTQVGVLFSVSQALQLCLVPLTPLIFRWLGLVNGVAVTQVATAVTLAALAWTHNLQFAVALYLGFSTLQWMGTPGLHTLLMGSVDDKLRSPAAAMMLFSNAVLGSATTAIAGTLFYNFGYPRVMTGIAALALLAAILFRSLVRSPHQPNILKPL